MRATLSVAYNATVGELSGKLRQWEEWARQREEGAGGPWAAGGAPGAAAAAAGGGGGGRGGGGGGAGAGEGET